MSLLFSNNYYHDFELSSIELKLNNSLYLWTEDYVLDTEDTDKYFNN